MLTFPRYQLYILRQLGLITLIVTFSLTSILWLMQALRYIDYIVNRGVSVSTFLHLTLLLLPSLLTTLLPVAVLTAAIFVYARLMQDSELIVLLAVGVSRLQAARPLIYLGAGLSALLYLFTFVVQPITEHGFKDLQSFLRDNFAALLLQEEVFNNPVDGLTVYMRERTDQGLLKGILVHDNRDSERPVTMMAKRATLTQTPTGPRFILQDGSRQELRDGRLSLLHFDRYPLDVNFYANQSSARMRKPSEMSVRELLAPNLAADEHRHRMAELHHRLTWPLLGSGLALLGLGIMLRGEFNRRGQPKRIAIAAGIALLPLVFGIMLDQAAANNAVFGPGMYANALLAMLVGLVLLSEVRLPQRLARP